MTAGPGGLPVPAAALLARGGERGAAQQQAGARGPQRGQRRGPAPPSPRRPPGLAEGRHTRYCIRTLHCVQLPSGLMFRNQHRVTILCKMSIYLLTVFCVLFAPDRSALGIVSQFVDTAACGRCIGDEVITILQHSAPRKSHGPAFPSVSARPLCLCGADM